MYLSGPSNAKVGQKITITANGAPSGTEQIKFTAEGNIGFDTVETTSGSASFQLGLDFAGTTRITAQAHDKFANALDSASHSVTVVDPAFEAAGGGFDRVGGWFMGPDTAAVGETIQLSWQNSDRKGSTSPAQESTSAVVRRARLLVHILKVAPRSRLAATMKTVSALKRSRTLSRSATRIAAPPHLRRLGLCLKYRLLRRQQVRRGACSYRI